MPFAAAFSVHPVSSLATGEVIGQIYERAGDRPDLLIVLATPGHRGALDDIVSAARRLLSPTVLLAAVTTGLGAGEDHTDGGPGLAAWSGTCGWTVAHGPSGRSADADADIADAAIGALVLTTSPAPSPIVDDLERRGIPVVAGVVAGPVLVEGGGGKPAGSGATGSGPTGSRAPGSGATGGAGVLFGPASGFRAAVAHGVRGIGPMLAVTRAEGAMLHELDGRPALQRLIDVARDGIAAADLPTLAAGLHLRRLAHAGEEPPVPVLGTDRSNGALAVAEPVDEGSVVQFAMPDPEALGPALGRSVHDARGAVVLSRSPTAELGRHGPPAMPGTAPAGPPAATLVCAADPLGRRAAERRDAMTSATAAYFT